MTAPTYPPKLFSITCIAIATTAFGILCASDPARATEPTTAPFHTVLWEVTSPTEDVFLEPQVYVATIESDNTSFWVGSTSLKCGTRYQADAYKPDAIPALIADNLLHGGEDQGVADHWLVFTTDACAPVVVPPVDVPVAPPVIAPPVEVPPVITAPEPTPEPVVLPVVEPIPAPVETPPATPVATTVPVLAATGFDAPQLPGIAALLLLVGVLAIVTARVFKQKRESK